jgi:hypothetical protein
MNNQKIAQPRTPPARRPVGLTLIVLLTLAGYLQATSTATAGTYTINDCPSAPTPSNNPGPWTVFGSPQSAKGSCAGGPGDYIAPRGASMNPGAFDGVQVTIPAKSPLTIREAKILWSVPHQLSGADNFALAQAGTTQSTTLVESTTPFTGSGSSNTFVLPSTTTSFKLSDYCSADDAAQGCNFGSWENNNLQLYGAQLTLEDPTLPTATIIGTPPPDGATISGTQSLAYTASDPTAGIRAVTLQVDGTQVAHHDYREQCTYENLLACPATISDAISWNTASLADGQHTLQLIIETAAHNTTIAYNATLTTHNTPTNPTPSTPADQLSPLSPASPTTSTAGTPNGTPASQTAHIHLTNARSLTRTYAQRAFTLTGQLLDPQGHPIANATLQILQQPTNTSTAEALTTAQTDAQGLFAAKIPPGPSRTVTVLYRAFASQPGYAATASVTEAVHASVTLRITPRHTGPTGTINIAGTVAGPTPPHGALVELLVYYQGGWQPIRTPYTDSHRHFHLRYQFHHATGRFPFRAQVPTGQASFPYRAGSSATVVITTTP